MDELKQVKENIPVRRTRAPKEAIGLRLRSDHLDAIERIAKRKGISYRTFIKRWLAEMVVK